MDAPMRKVAPLWRVAALALPLAAAPAGCDLIPVRHRLDPSLYPVPTRPTADYLRGREARPTPDPLPPPRRGAGPTPPADRAAAVPPPDLRELPDLPDLHPVTPEEALGLAVTDPAELDAAVARAAEVRAMTLGDPEPPAPIEPVGPEPPGPIPEEVRDPLVLEPIPTAEVPAPPPSWAEAELEAPPVEIVEPEPEPTPEPGPEAAAEPGPEVVAAPPAAEETPADHWRVGLANLLTLAESEAERGGASSEVWAARRRVLDWLAEAEGEVDETSLWQTVLLMLSEPEAAPDPEAPNDLPPPPPSMADVGPDASAGPARGLRISDLRLCREVVAFGHYRAIDASDCRAGQDVILYCELDGVGYESHEAGSRSRLVTALELVAEGSETPLWRDVRPAEDACEHPRRDYFVGYLLTLPRSLAPGRYRLRVAQRDLVSGRIASDELAFAVRTGP